MPKETVELDKAPRKLLRYDLLTSPEYPDVTVMQLISDEGTAYFSMRNSEAAKLGKMLSGVVAKSGRRTQAKRRSAN